MISSFFSKLMGNSRKKDYFITKEEIAELLKTDPSALESFEKEYQNISGNVTSENFFQVNAKQIQSLRDYDFIPACDMRVHKELVNEIVQELKSKTVVWEYDEESIHSERRPVLTEERRVSLETIQSFPEEIQPDFTGFYLKRDIAEPSYVVLLDHLQRMQRESNPRKKQF